MYHYRLEITYKDGYSDFCNFINIYDALSYISAYYHDVYSLTLTILSED